MPVNNDYPVLDGIAPSWADIAVKLAANGAALIELKDIKAINTGCKIEVGSQYAGGRVMKRTTGSSTYDASMTVYREAWQRMLRTLKGVAPKRGNQSILGLVHFGINVQHTPPGSVELFEYRIKGCRILGRNLNGAEGNDADVVEIPLSPIEIVDVIDGEEVVIL
jgi:hypothetical protein